jgi:hypothetical protein
MSNLPGFWGQWGGGYLAFFLAGFLVSEPWRWGGALLGRNIDPASELFTWVRAVSTAIVAGLVARMLVFPAGALADVGFAVRIVAIAFGIAGYAIARRSIGAGVAAGVAALLIGQRL